MCLSILSSVQNLTLVWRDLSIIVMPTVAFPFVFAVWPLIFQLGNRSAILRVFVTASTNQLKTRLGVYSITHSISVQMSPSSIYFLNNGVIITTPLPCIELIRDLLTPHLLVVFRQNSCICSPIAEIGISTFLNITGNSENFGIRCSGVCKSHFTKPNDSSDIIPDIMSARLHGVCDVR